MTFWTCRSPSGVRSGRGRGEAGQSEGVPAQQVDVVPEERWEAGHVLVTDVGTVSTQPIHRGVRVPGVEQHEGVEDQSQRPDLVLSELAEHNGGLSIPRAP